MDEWTWWYVFLPFQYRTPLYQISAAKKNWYKKSGVVIKGPIDFVSEIPLEEEKVEIVIEWVAKSWPFLKKILLNTSHIMCFLLCAWIWKFLHCLGDRSCRIYIRMSSYGSTAMTIKAELFMSMGQNLEIWVCFFLNINFHPRSLDVST